ncbi:hypothetical protein OKW43_001815 [Paraburkholderia sp. WC7.3g]|uniref:Uncharacterized protein n=1 Tax=Paraburkholderia podalyriae TaxID=1938811 RepID=A0ABR7PR69_9BURK|nr:hypothetical protein [Paraburkholderia podalyriae]MBC8748785.1 hypothetical protein [Paraburkholderia podalyriae]
MRKSLVAALLCLSVTSLSYGGDGDRSDGRENGERGEHRVLKVFDAQGKSVGPLVSVSSPPRTAGVVLNINGATILVPIQRASNSGGQISASQYEWAGDFNPAKYPTSDCSGVPVIDDIFAKLRPSSVVRQGADATVYVAPDTYSMDVTLRSSLVNGDCVSSSPFPFNVPGWQAESTYSLTQNNPEPLTIHY